jgi:hypothetical protein
LAFWVAGAALPAAFMQFTTVWPSGKQGVRYLLIGHGYTSPGTPQTGGYSDGPWSDSRHRFCPHPQIEWTCG